MMSERKRKWILGTIVVVLLGGPLGTLNPYTLNRIQRNIRTKFAAGQIEPWMPKWQYNIACIYRYTLQSEQAADAYQQYMMLFYETEKGSSNKEEHDRAEDIVWTYPNVLDDIQKRYDSYRYICLLLEDWPDHPRHVEAETRKMDLEKGGYQFPPGNLELRPLPYEK